MRKSRLGGGGTNSRALLSNENTVSAERELLGGDVGYRCGIHGDLGGWRKFVDRTDCANEILPVFRIREEDVRGAVEGGEALLDRSALDLSDW